jgi:ATP-dependent Lon protease
MGRDRDLGSYDFNIQVMSPMHGKDTADLGVAFFIAILSAASNRSIKGGLVALGQMSIHGVLSRLDNLGDALRVAMEAGARQVLIPTTTAADLGSIPGELLDKLWLEFYSDPMAAAFKALVEG